VLILDEATSSLDIPSERLVQTGLARLLRATSEAGSAAGGTATASAGGGRTALIIAHRLSTVETADRVLVVHDGRVVEDGTPAELIGGGGRFADLHGAWKDSLV
jgi:ATP-binding cassette subfamily B protein